ncbi:FAD:protein FMN transferase [Streptomyces sp. NPDC046332]|uniref:FAD:protein FMN transferase n=1 Tax=unclassified Streptomyces TaxID=2593676 RepID=UPI0033CA62A2
MGTVFSFDVRGRADDSRTREALGRAVAFLHHMDAVFSTYREDSDVSRLARGELTPADCDPAVSAVRRLCEEAERRTEGWFTAGYGRRAGLPVAWDPTGLVKGWATERAAHLMAEAAPEAAVCVNGGGDIQLLGGPWRIGITDPLAPGELATVVEVGTEVPCAAIATSGPAERGCHILDPHTGLPPAHALAALTVVCPSLTDADALATAAYARGEGARAWLERQPGTEGFATEADGTVWRTSGFDHWSARGFGHGAEGQNRE